MISTTDFFYPLIHDPYLQGKIGCANVLSDMYAMGVVDCDTLLMLLAASLDMQENERNVVTRRLIEGFSDLAKQAGTSVSGGQTVMNPWPIIGGVATSVCRDSDFILPEHAVAGDVLVLTKPLGTQIAVNAFQWQQKADQWARWAEGVITHEQADEAYRKAVESMTRLNRNGARLMHKYGAHGATDVTGFGLIGHARNLAKNQRAAVNFELHTLPVIAHMLPVDAHVSFFKLRAGFSAETSGGLLLTIPESEAAAFCAELQQLDGQPAWVIGRVVANPTGDKSTNSADIVSSPTIIQV